MYETDYETVAASQTAQVLGPAAGNTTSAGYNHILKRLVIIPATTAPGAVSILDGNASGITVYAGGTVGADLTPMVVELNMRARLGPWQVTTGANVSVIAVGKFPG